REHDMLIVGDVDECIEKAMRYADAGVDQLMCYCEYGNMSHDAVMRNLELLGTKVIPELKEYKPDLSRYSEDDDKDEKVVMEKLGGIKYAHSPGGVGDPAAQRTGESA